MRKVRPGVVSTWLLVAACIAACNGEDDGVANVADGAAQTPPIALPPADPATIDAVCGEQASVQCGRFKECLGFLHDAVYGSPESCLAREKLRCSLRLGAQGTRADATFMRACTQAVAAASCDDVAADRITFIPVPGCVAPTGTVGNGLPCGTDEQCQSGYCKRAGDCGVCAVRVQPGHTCDRASDCQLGFLCQAGVCVRAGSEGQTCATDVSCRGSLTCIENRCARALPPGSPCDPDNDKCAIFTGLACHPMTMVCTPIELVAAGETCGYLGTGQVALCSGGGNCDVALFENTGACVPPLADGEGCGNSASLCVEPAFCSSAAVCTLPTPNRCL